MPNISQYLKTYDENIAGLQQNDFLLDKIVHATKARSVTFGNLAAKLQHDILQRKSSYISGLQNTWELSMLIIIASLCLFTFASNLYLWRRFIVTAAIVQSLQATASASQLSRDQDTVYILSDDSTEHLPENSLMYDLWYYNVRDCDILVVLILLSLWIQFAYYLYTHRQQTTIT